MRRIVAGEIKEVLCFEVGERPVWLTTFTNGEKLVVKAEMNDRKHANKSIPLAGMMMQRATGALQTEMLEDKELKALEALTQNLERFRPAEVAASSRDYLKLYMGAEGRALFAFYKMPFFKGVGNVQSVVNKFGAGLMLMQLKIPPALFILGKIAAVDQFIGNYDRFTRTGGIQNIGNFLFEKIGATITPIGLDFFEAQGTASNLTEPPPDHVRVGKTVQYEWGGENLLNENNIRFFADHAMASLNEYFQGSQPGRIPVKLLDQPAILEFGNGMIAGTLELKRFLGAKAGLPAGVTARMAKLNWPYTPGPARPSTPAPRRRTFKTAGPNTGRGNGSAIGAHRG